MKIGVMLRQIGDQTDAPGIIVLNLMDQLLRLDNRNEYVLFYKDRAFMDRYAAFPHVRSVRLSAPSKLVWDQVTVPLAARRHKIDLLFHPKHSLPLLAQCKTLMQLRGSEHWTYPEYYERADLMQYAVMLPRYVQKATHLIVESDFVKEDFRRHLRLPAAKMTRVYLAPSPRFKVITDPDHLASIRQKYGLPENFLLTVTRIVQGKKYYAGKNLDKAIRAFARSQAREHLKFVVVGKQTRQFVDTLADIPDDVRRDVIALDFVPQEDLAAIYNLAHFFVFPSSYESFGIPLTEAMACGCPVIASSTGACPEIVEDAGLIVHPENVEQIASAMDRLARDAALRDCLTQRGLDRAARFTWQRAAEETLQVIDALA